MSPTQMLEEFINYSSRKSTVYVSYLEQADYISVIFNDNEVRHALHCSM